MEQSSNYDSQTKELLAIVENLDFVLSKVKAPALDREEHEALKTNCAKVMEYIKNSDSRSQKEDSIL